MVMDEVLREGRSSPIDEQLLVGQKIEAMQEQRGFSRSESEFSDGARDAQWQCAQHTTAALRCCCSDCVVVLSASAKKSVGWNLRTLLCIVRLSCLDFPCLASSTQPDPEIIVTRLGRNITNLKRKTERGRPYPRAHDSCCSQSPVSTALNPCRVRTPLCQGLPNPCRLVKGFSLLGVSTVSFPLGFIHVR